MGPHAFMIRYTLGPQVHKWDLLWGPKYIKSDLFWAIWSPSDTSHAALKPSSNGRLVAGAFGELRLQGCRVILPQKAVAETCPLRMMTGSKYVNACVYIDIHVYKNILHLYTQNCICICFYLCKYVHTCVKMCIYAYSYIYIYIRALYNQKLQCSFFVSAVGFFFR